MLEALIQSGAWLMRYSEDFRFSTVLLREARAVRFNNFVTPGNTLSIEVSVHKWNGNECTLKGSGTVDGKSAVNARLTLQQFNLADNNPGMKGVDERQTTELRSLFHQICPAQLLSETAASAP